MGWPTVRSTSPAETARTITSGQSRPAGAQQFSRSFPAARSLTRVRSASRKSNFGRSLGTPTAYRGKCDFRFLPDTRAPRKSAIRPSLRWDTRAGCARPRRRRSPEFPVLLPVPAAGHRAVARLASILPPGNSHFSGIVWWRVRWHTSSLPSFAIKAATTRFMMEDSAGVVAGNQPTQPRRNKISNRP